MADSAGLRLGPLLRYVDWEAGDHATVWVETDRPCTVEVRCADGASGSSSTFRIADHHYALVTVRGLTPGTSTAYEVRLDGATVWPLANSAFPASTITTPQVPSTGVTVSFGSCRWAAAPAGEHDPVGPDALDTLAARLAHDPLAARPDVLLLLGDQVYADETSKATRAWLAERRDLSEPPGAEVTNYEEYTHLYDESWLDPEVRWLFSTIPSLMVFDDHDVIDDWNTSASWLTEIRAQPWWHERILSGLMSYWVYQHLGNLSPAELESDELFQAVRASSDGTAALREFAERADADPLSTRWSYRRDFDRTRLLMVDTRAARVLDEQHRAMLDPEEAHWLREQALEGLPPRGPVDGPVSGGTPTSVDPLGRETDAVPAGAMPAAQPEPTSAGSDPTAGAAYDHLLIGTSLPWLLPPLIHDTESWNAALCRGERGARWARFGERLRRAADLEHWAAFPRSFDELTALVAEVGTGAHAPATISVLSGDVHHAYVAEPDWRGAGDPDSRVFQLTCSPVHNSIPRMIQLGFHFGWSRMGRRLGHLLARHGRTGRPPVHWSRSGGPWFGNQLMTLTLRGRSARLRLEQAGTEPTERKTQGGGRGVAARLLTVDERQLAEGGTPASTG
ncbi:alkaline phosphatase D family protein [Streptomyces albipurpureus]|uniref:Alkaline phosphatase family protein n=1 Tax=Streptomyces albipurpureus TaxID=2897419 RepID=A0ABT0UJ72_9ACTN|nr:alkaline phosphatase D family protein [Streptomyces sp. CWNU-1]MCM2388693.1 alkaline phosphatase family protein [Streptomyces sp. CWNU-1]